MSGPQRNGSEGYKGGVANVALTISMRVAGAVAVRRWESLTPQERTKGMLVGIVWEAIKAAQESEIRQENQPDPEVRRKQTLFAAIPRSSS